MITAAAQAISNQLQMQVWLSNANDLLFELKTILQLYLKAFCYYVTMALSLR